jgi:hypothetical protein
MQPRTWAVYWSHVQPLEGLDARLQLADSALRAFRTKHSTALQTTALHCTER